MATNKNVAFLVYEGEIEINEDLHTVSKLKVTSAQKEKAIFSFGESIPFAVMSDKPKYTVDIEGIDSTGLDEKSGFTVSLPNENKTEERVVFRGCVWTKIQPEERKMTFISYDKAFIKAENEEGEHENKN